MPGNTIAAHPPPLHSPGDCEWPPQRGPAQAFSNSACETSGTLWLGKERKTAAVSKNKGGDAQLAFRSGAAGKIVPRHSPRKQRRQLRGALPWIASRDPAAGASVGSKIGGAHGPRLQRNSEQPRQRNRASSGAGEGRSN